MPLNHLPTRKEPKNRKYQLSWTCDSKQSTRCISKRLHGLPNQNKTESLEGTTLSKVKLLETNEKLKYLIETLTSFAGYFREDADRQVIYNFLFYHLKQSAVKLEETGSATVIRGDFKRDSHKTIAHGNMTWEWTKRLLSWGRDTCSATKRYSSGQKGVPYLPITCTRTKNNWDQAVVTRPHLVIYVNVALN